MPTNGNTFTKDKETGYLVPNNNNGLVAFGVEGKKRFLELYEKTGNMAEACDIVGVSLKTFYNHVNLDEAFSRDIRITMKRMEEKLTGTMFQKGLEPNGTMDRFGWLRAHNPEKWNPKQQVNVTSDGHLVDNVFSALLDHKRDTGSLIDVSPIVDADTNLSTEGSEHPDSAA